MTDLGFKAVTDESEKRLLKGVSRSFYLSLRLLPRPMRGAAGLGYLLARASDTLADSVTAPLEVRLQLLDQFDRAVASMADAPRWPMAILNATAKPQERHLLECSGEIFTRLRNLPEAEAALVREVLKTIVSGQKLDLTHFASASREHLVALPDDAALEDYAWRVAGSVGAFWTKLGFLTLGPRFSNAAAGELIDRGIAYGKGLQLVNILRDLAADLAIGRCYLPVADCGDRDALLACHARWLELAGAWVGEGEIYAKTLNSRRLRAATVLPSLLARKTLEPLRGATWEALQSRMKIPRSAVYQSVICALCWK